MKGEMNRVLVRYGEIGTKAEPVRVKMISILRQRVQDRLEYEGLDFEKVGKDSGRIIVETENAEEAAEMIAELPGVVSASPAVVTQPEIEAMKKASKGFKVGETFGIAANRSGEHGFDSRDVQRELGSFVEERTGADVDLDNPDTLLEVDVRRDKAYLFKDRFDGPNGLPVEAGDSLAALVSGGIDSPVAAYRVMTRGCDILPVYFYNKPIAAEDHLLRLKAVLKKLQRFHPSKKWEYYVIDMEEVNKELMEVGRGRMLLHRRLMFLVSEKIAEREELKGLVTGESIGQKSSQTPSSLELTSSVADKPIFRPLVAQDKNSITEEARSIRTFEEAEVASACRAMAPENPATSMSEEDLEKLEEKVGLDSLVETALESSEKKVLQP